MGYTTRLEERIKEHKQSKLAHRNKDYDLIFFEGFTSQEDAERREQYFKTTKGRRSLRLMLSKTLN